MLPENERQLLIVGCVERDSTSNSVFNPRLEALECQWLVVNGKLIDKELSSDNEIGQITNTEDTDTTLPDTMTLHLWIPLGVDGKERLRLRVTCKCRKY